MALSANKGYSLQTTGSNSGAWGAGATTALNEGCFQVIDANLGGVTTKTLTNVDVTLSSTEAQNLTLVLNGTLTGNVQITNACIGQFYVDNQCTGSFAVTVTNGVGSAVTVTNGSKIAVIADGTNGCRQVGAGITSIVTGFGLTGGTITSTGTASISTSAPPFGFDAPINLGLSATIAANALTIYVKDQAGSDPTATSPVLIPFRNVTAATGTPTWLSVTAALSLTISSGSTVGTSNSVPFRVWLVLFNDANTIRLGIINCLTSSGVVPLFEGVAVSSTAEGGAGTADSAGVFYTGTAVSSKAFRIIGYLEYTSGLTTAGTWNALPDIVQPFGPGIKKPGDIIQSQIYTTNALASTTATIPLDDTIPQITEGAEFMQLTLTPSSKSSMLRITTMLATFYNIAAGNAICALFQDSGANAIAANTAYYGGTNNLFVMHQIQASTTSSTTFKLRAGPSDVFPGTLVMNAANGTTRKLGGSVYSRIVVDEIMA